MKNIYEKKGRGGSKEKRMRQEDRVMREGRGG